MPYVDTWEPKGLVRKWSGFITGAEFASAVQRTAADARFGNLRYIISDFLDVLGHSIEEREMESVAASRIGSGYTNPKIRVALITTDPSIARLKDMIDSNMFRTPYETRVLASVAEARDWLAVESPGQFQWRNP